MKMTATAFCLCGESLTLSGTEQGVSNGFKLWEQSHKGAGHGPTDRKTCARNRKTANHLIPDLAWKGQSNLFQESEAAST